MAFGYGYGYSLEELCLTTDSELNKVK
jgi:hypothetical protein